MINLKRPPFKVGDKVRVVPYVGDIHFGLMRYHKENTILTVDTVVLLGTKWYVGAAEGNLPSTAKWFAERFALVERKHRMENAFLVRLKDFRNAIIPADDPGFAPEMVKMIGTEVSARELNDEEKRFYDKPWVFTDGGVYWPIAFIDVVNDKEKLKAMKARLKKAAKAKLKLKKPAKKFLRSELRKQVGGNPGTCSYGIERKDGSFKMHIRDVCHARLRLEGGMKAAALHVKSHYEKAPDDCKKTYVQFMNYLFNRSPYAVAFKTKKASEALAREIAMDVDNATLSQIVAGAIALRLASEYKGFLPAFQKVKELGGSEHAAFFIASTHQYINNNWSRNWNGGHNIMAHYLKYSNVIKAFKEGCRKVQDRVASKWADSYAVFQTIDETNSGWNKNEKVPAAETIQGVFTSYAPETVVGKGWDGLKQLGDKQIQTLAKCIDVDFAKL